MATPIPGAIPPSAVKNSAASLPASAPAGLPALDGPAFDGLAFDGPAFDRIDPLAQRALFDALPVLLFLERSGQVIFANTAARRLMGVEDRPWTGRAMEELLWGLYPSLAEPDSSLTGPRVSGRCFHASLAAGDGETIAIEGAYCMLNESRREAVIVAHASGRAPAARPGMMDDVLASIPEAVAIEHGGHLLYVNPAFTAMFGFGAEEAAGGNLFKMIVPETRQSEYAMLHRAVDEKGPVTLETLRQNREGELIDVSLQCAALRVAGAPVGYVHTYRDIALRKQTELRLEHDALYDALTGLPNRILFLDRLRQALSRRERRPELSCGVLFLNLDHFRQINDALGIAAGDALLQAVAQRLRASLRPQDTAARLSGDEFAILVENIAASSDLEVVVRRLQGAMEKSFDVFGHFVQIGCSMGVAMAGRGQDSPEELIRAANYAMDCARQSGQGCYKFFDQHLEGCVSSQQEQERTLRALLEARQFAYRFQPVYLLADGQVAFFEALLRWHRPEGIVDGFDELMQVAENTGLSITLGREALEAACHQLRVWRELAPRAQMSLSINLTRRQFYHVDLERQLRAVLEASAAPPERLLLEASESTLNENPERALAIVQRLAECRVRVVMDDFGAGLAAVNSLLRLPLAAVKLAPQLTAAVTGSGPAQKVMENLLRLGGALGVRMVAQDIREPRQLQALLQLGCTLGQGPLLAAPLDPA